MKKIFVAYSYRDFGQPYRDALAARFEGSGVEFLYADDRIENKHVLDKIRDMMTEADTCMFDITKNNPNVMLELGVALGVPEPGFVAVDARAITEISADVTGWDQLRYSSFEELAEKLYDKVTNGKVPRRKVRTSEQPNVLDVLHQIKFGVPAIEAASLCVYVVPVEYERYYIDRKKLGAPPYRGRDLCDSVYVGPNVTHHSTYFWPDVCDYSGFPGVDFVEVYDAAKRSERDTNFRVYLSGATSYMQRLNRGGDANAPFMYAYSFEHVVEMALLSSAAMRSKLGFDDQAELAVGAAFLNAPDLRISRGRPNFTPARDRGYGPTEPSDEMLVPDEPIVVGSVELASKAKELAETMSAYLLSQATEVEEVASEHRHGTPH